MTRTITIISLLLIIGIIMSLWKTDNQILPKKYSTKEISSFYTILDKVKEQEITPKINENDLSDYPKDFKGNWWRVSEQVLVKWTIFKELDNKTKNHIIDILNEMINEQKGDEKHKLIELLSEITTSEKYYFSGQGGLGKASKDETYNFYNFIYFLNIETSKLIEFEYQSDF